MVIVKKQIWKKLKIYSKKQQIYREVNSMSELDSDPEKFN